MAIKFKGTPKPIGNSFYLRVPMAYIENKLIPLDKPTTFLVDEGKKEDEPEK